MTAFKRMAFIIGAMTVTNTAMADEASIYGYISTGIESAGATGSTNGKASQMRITDNNSRIGFRGNEELGNGLKAIWQIEQSLRNFEQGGTTDWGQSATFATRNSFVGVEDRTYGRAVIGYNDNAYKSLVGSTSSDFSALDVLGNTTADTWGSAPGSYAIFSRGETRMKNSLHYTSPNLAGFTFGASYGFDETRKNGNTQSRYSLAGKYVNGGLRIGLGWDRQNDTAGYAQGNYLNASGTTVSTTSSVAGKHIDYYKLVAAYQFGTGTVVGGGVEQGRYDKTTSGSMHQTGWTVGASQPIGPWTLKASYSKLGGLSNPTTGAAEDYRASQWAAGTTYALSKRTTLFGYYTIIHNGSEQNVNFGFNQEVATSNGSSVVLGKGNTLHALGVGVGISF